MVSTRRIPLVALALILLCGAVVLSLGRLDGASAAGADGGWVEHPGLVPDSPERGYPIIRYTNTLDARGRRPQTYAIDLVGNYIISGGNFTQIELQNGTIINQPYLSIVDWRTKEQVCTNLDVDDEVLAIAPGPDDDTAIIGGRFDKITGADGVERTRNKVALINMKTCEVDRNWIMSGVNGKVTEIAVRNDRMFIGGDFSQAGGFAIERLAEGNHNTGAINPNFSFVFGGELSRAIVGMEVNPAGTRLGIVHRATSINGQAMRGTAIFNISNQNNPTLTNHRMATNLAAYTYYNDIQDGAFSPDFQHVGMVQGTATVSDYVTVLNTTESPNQFKWVKFMRDSSFSIAMTNNTAYVGGHFCKIDTGPGATATMAPNSGPGNCTGTAFAGGVWRTQVAALSMANGTPQTWNPGNDSFRGAAAVTVVNRGLLLGFDGNRSDNIRTGTTAFFDFGAPADPRDGQTCTATVNQDQTVSLSWTNVAGIDDWSVRRNNSFVAITGARSYTDDPPPGTYDYDIRSQLDGIQWDTSCNTVTVTDPPGADQSCTASVDDGVVTLSWTAIAGEDSYQVRRDDTWQATQGGLNYNESPGAGSYVYEIKSKMDGVTTLTSCTPSPTVVGDAPPPPPADQNCTATFNANGSATVAWTSIDGENSYVVRKNGTFLASAGNALSYNDPGASAGDEWVIRSRMGGVTTNTTCTNQGNPPADECNLDINGNQATLTWTAFNNENDNYVIRVNGVFEALVPSDGLLSWTGDAVGGATYTVRSREGGVNNDLSCD
jgi:hypothetical protein